MNKIILYFLCLGFTTFLNAQNVKSILLRPANNPKQYNSIVKLGNVLELSFDDLDADNKDYYYKINYTIITKVYKYFLRIFFKK